MKPARRIGRWALTCGAVFLAVQPWILVASGVLVLTLARGRVVWEVGDAAIGWQLKAAMYTIHAFPLLATGLKLRVNNVLQGSFWLGWGLAWSWLRVDPGGFIGAWLD